MISLSNGMTTLLEHSEACMYIFCPKNWFQKSFLIQLAVTWLRGSKTTQIWLSKLKWKKNDCMHGLRTPGEDIAFTARPKIKSQSQIFRYGQSIFCLPHQPKIPDFFDLCLSWVSVVVIVLLGLLGDVHKGNFTWNLKAFDEFQSLLDPPVRFKAGFFLSEMRSFHKSR